MRCISDLPALRRRTRFAVRFIVTFGILYLLSFPLARLFQYFGF